MGYTAKLIGLLMFLSCPTLRALIITYCPTPCAPIERDRAHRQVDTVECSKCQTRIVNHVDPERLFELRSNFDALYALCEWCSIGEYVRHIAENATRIPYRKALDEAATSESQRRWSL